METIQCPISGSDQVEAFLSVPDRFNPQNGYAWHLQRFKESGLVVLNPRPDQEEIAGYYETENYDPFVSTASKLSLSQRIYESLRRWISLRSKAKSVLARAKFPDRGKYRVLEIGCATGEFMAMLQKVAAPSILRCMGVEPSKSAGDYAKQQYGLNVLHGELLDVDIAEKMDLILMWHSLEHIHRINETLEKIHQILKPNGLLCVAMPNLASSDAHHYREHWVAYDAPRHLYHFSPLTFEKLLKKHGFNIEEMQGLPIDSFYNTLLSEQLKAGMQQKKLSMIGIINAVLLGFNAAVEGVHPGKASSVLYYVRKQTNH